MQSGAMKTLLRFAAGAAVAGALVNALRKHRSGKNARAVSYDETAYPQTGEFTPTELVADSSSVGEGSGDDRVLLPDDGRVGQSQVNS